MNLVFAPANAHRYLRKTVPVILSASLKRRAIKMGRHKVYDGPTEQIGGKIPKGNYDLLIIRLGRKSMTDFLNESVEEFLKRESDKLESDKIIIESYRSKSQSGGEQINKGPIYEIKIFITKTNDLKNLTIIFPQLKEVFELAQSKINRLQGRDTKPKDITTLNPVEKLRVDSLEFQKDPLSHKAGIMEATLLQKLQEKSEKNRITIDLQKRKLKVQDGLDLNQPTEIMIYQPNEHLS